MPFWKKPTIDDQVIDLKMSSKTLNRQYKKCMDEASAYEKKMKAEIAKHNQDTAKIYAESAVRMRTQGRQFMVMASRVEAAALNLQSVASMATVSKAMATSVAAIKSASSALDISKMYKVMDEFKNACEDNEVMMDGFISAVGTQDVESSESAEALYQQAAMEYANATGEPYDSCPSDMKVNPAAVQQQPQLQAIPNGGSDDILNRLNKL